LYVYPSHTMFEIVPAPCTGAKMALVSIMGACQVTYRAVVALYPRIQYDLIPGASPSTKIIVPAGCPPKYCKAEIRLPLASVPASAESG
jgi:hypothetical protein